MMIVLMVMAAEPKSCDVPAGSTGGDSAGNNQPDSKAASCSLLPKIKTIPIGYVQQAGLTYTASAYLMDGECEILDPDDGEALKITLAALDSIGRRVGPKLDSSPQPSPWTGLINLALPTSYDIRLVVTGNLSPRQVRETGTVLVGCQLIPSDVTSYLSSTKIADIGAGKGKVVCDVAKG